jgi:hypothetical protein
LKFFQQRIELGVSNFWSLIDVVQIFVAPDQFAKLENSCGRIHARSEAVTNN